MFPRVNKHALFCGFALLLLSGISQSAFGQTSLFQDAKGELSIILANQSLLSINSGDASVGFSYALFQSTKNTYWGFSIKLKAEEGVSYVLKSGRISLNGSLGLLHGWRNSSRKGIIDDFYISGNISSSKFKLFDEPGSFENQIIDERSIGISMKTGWNRMSSTTFLSGGNENTTTTIFGLSLGAGRTNNLDSLDKVSISDYSSINDEESGKSRLIQGKSTSAFSPYAKYADRLGFIQLNADYAIIPGIFRNRVLLIIFSRGRFARKREAPAGPGDWRLSDQEGGAA